MIMGHLTADQGAFFEVNRSLVENEIRSGRTVSFVGEVDLTSVERIRSESFPVKPSYTAFVVHALAACLKEFPYANRRVLRRSWMSFWKSRLQIFSAVDVAVACERNLEGSESIAFFDVLRNADLRSLEEITLWLHALSKADEKNNAQWRGFKNVIERLPLFLSKWILALPLFFPSLWEKWRGGAALVSSPAKYGVDMVLGSWTSPLGVSFGLVKERAIVQNGEVVARPTFFLSLNFDRRIMAGAQAARFFKRMVELLEIPLKKQEKTKASFPQSKEAHYG